MAATPKATARRWFDEVINARRPEAVYELFALGYVLHSSRGGVIDRAEFKQFAAELLAAYPDRKSTVDDLVAEGDAAVERWSSSGHRQGTFQGLPATGDLEAAAGIWIVRVEDGHLAEGWEVVDPVVGEG